MENNFSAESHEQQNQKHCLENQLDAINFTSWKNNSNDCSEEPQESILQQFDINLPLESKFGKQVANQGQYQRNNRSYKLKENLNESDVSNYQQSMPLSQILSKFQNKNVPIVQEQLPRNINELEKKKIINEKSQLFKDNKINNYALLIKQLKHTLQKLIQFNKKSESNLQMYQHFINLKYQQQKLRLNDYDYDELNNNLKQLCLNPAYNLMYLNERIVTIYANQRFLSQYQKLKAYCQNIKKNIDKLQTFSIKIIQSRSKKIKYIETEIMNKMDKIELEMSEMIQYCESNEFQKNFDIVKRLNNTNISKDRYLQNKFLREREIIYLELIQCFKKKIVMLIRSIFLKQEPAIYQIINHQIKRLIESNKILYEESTINYEEHVDIQRYKNQFQLELAQILIDILPDSFNENETKNNSLSLIQQVIDTYKEYLQNINLQGSFEVNPSFIIFGSEATWTNTSINSRLPLQSKKQKQKTSVQASYQALITERQMQNTQNKVIGSEVKMRVTVIITVDNYLHLECKDKIATMKISEINFKNKNKMILVSKALKSISQLFSQQKLGIIQFFEESDQNLFLSTVTKK